MLFYQLVMLRAILDKIFELIMIKNNKNYYLINGSDTELAMLIEEFKKIANEVKEYDQEYEVIYASESNKES